TLVWPGCSNLPILVPATAAANAAPADCADTPRSADLFGSTSTVYSGPTVWFELLTSTTPGTAPTVCVTCATRSLIVSGSGPATATWIACPPKPPKPNG